MYSFQLSISPSVFTGGYSVKAEGVLVMFPSDGIIPSVARRPLSVSIGWLSISFY